MCMKSAKEIKKEFSDRGLSISGWAKAHGYSQALVYQVLSGSRKPTRGESHQIAVALGLKEGIIGEYKDLNFSRRELTS